MTSFAEALSALKTTADDDEKRRLSDQLCSMVNEDRALVASLCAPVIRLASIQNHVMAQVMSTEYVRTRYAVYRDGSGNPRVSVGVAFLLDYDSESNDVFDEDLAYAIARAVEDENLNLVINDIVVNTFQLVDGKEVVR